MEEYRVENIYEKTGAAHVTVEVPGSKSITNRALLLAALSDGPCLLRGALFSDDSRHFISCVQALGIDVQVDEEQRSVRVTGRGGEIPNRGAHVYVGSAGTAARFITALLGVSEGTYYLDASAQMRKRPMAPLLAALRDLGCTMSFDGQENCFPFWLTSQGVQKNDITVDIGDSSQFLSALLISGVCPENGLSIHVTGSHGMSYIRITTEMMKQFGVQVQQPEEQLFVVPGGKPYHREVYDIEPDMSAAAYFYAAAAILGISVTVQGVHRDMLQGDIRFLDVLEEMGCTVAETTEGVQVTGPAKGRLKGITLDMGAFSDQAITLAAIAPYGDSPTTITGIGHIRHQESDRIGAMVDALTRMGIQTEELEDGIRIWPGQPHAARIRTYDDHRVAMGFALTGLRADGIVIEDPGCCRKTFENYFEVLDDFVRKMQ